MFVVASRFAGKGSEAQRHKFVLVCLLLATPAIAYQPRTMRVEPVDARALIASPDVTFRVRPATAEERAATRFRDVSIEIRYTGREPRFVPVFVETDRVPSDGNRDVYTSACFAGLVDPSKGPTPEVHLIRDGRTVNVIEMGFDHWRDDREVYERTLNFGKWPPDAMVFGLRFDGPGEVTMHGFYFWSYPFDIEFSYFFAILLSGVVLLPLTKLPKPRRFAWIVTAVRAFPIVFYASMCALGVWQFTTSTADFRPGIPVIGGGALGILLALGAWRGRNDVRPATAPNPRRTKGILLLIGASLSLGYTRAGLGFHSGTLDHFVESPDVAIEVLPAPEGSRAESIRVRYEGDDARFVPVVRYEPHSTRFRFGFGTVDVSVVVETKSVEAGPYPEAHFHLTSGRILVLDEFDREFGNETFSGLEAIAEFPWFSKLKQMELGFRFDGPGEIVFTYFRVYDRAHPYGFAVGGLLVLVALLLSLMGRRPGPSWQLKVLAFVHFTAPSFYLTFSILGLITCAAAIGESANQVLGVTLGFIVGTLILYPLRSSATEKYFGAKKQSND